MQITLGQADDFPAEDNFFVASLKVDPKRIAAWGEFHQAVENLPEAEKEVVDLLWYQGLKQHEAAELIGVDERTIKRRWREAKLKLSEVLDGSLISM